MAHEPYLHTFSIVAYDPQTHSWGIAVASKYLAIGAIVPFAKAGAGAIATQALTNMSFGPVGLALLSQGKTAQEVLDELLKNDDQPDSRQLGIVDSLGNAVTYTGKNCQKWAGGIAKNHLAIQGNLLTSEQTLFDMEKTFFETNVDFTHKLYAALAAGDAAGGDKRGKQAAAILVVKEKAGLNGYTDRYIDLRIDDHENPVEALGQLLKKSHLAI